MSAFTALATSRVLTAILPASLLDAFLMPAVTLAQLLLLAWWVRAGSAVWQVRGQQPPQAAPAYITLGAALTLMPAPLLYSAVVGMLSIPRCYSVALQALLLHTWPEVLTAALALCAATMAKRMRVGEAARLFRFVVVGAVTLAVIKVAMQWSDLHRYPDATCSAAETAALGLPLADGWPALLAFGALGWLGGSFCASRTIQPL